MTPDEAAVFYEDDEDPAGIFARFDSGLHVLTTAPKFDPVAEIKRCREYIRTTYGGGDAQCRSRR